MSKNLRWIAAVALAPGWLPLARAAEDGTAGPPAGGAAEVAEVAGKASGEAGAASEEVPPVAALIAPVVERLPGPRLGGETGGLRLAVSGATKEVQEHVLEGTNLVLSNWDFEAYRHFCAALRLDPQCLMAHWGICLCLADPGHEFGGEREAALRRMAWLARQGAGTELERGLAYGMIVYYRDGAAAAGEAFRQLGEKFPNETLAKLLGALFGRGGYDEFGDPTPDQERAERAVGSLMALQPGNPLLTSMWLLVRAEGPVRESDLERARDLCRRVPEVPSYQHMLGHYEWRGGNLEQAAAAFGRAAALFDAWRKRDGVALADCPGWVKAEAYRVVALAGAGDHEAAMAAAKALAAVPLDVKRAGAPGMRMMWWEGRTLTARLLGARNRRGDAKAALASLPKPEEVQPFGGKTTVQWFLQGLVLWLEARKSLEAKELDRARQLVGLLAEHGAKMAESRAQAVEAGELSFWMRGQRGLETLAAELRGDLALAGPASGRASAYNWFLAAADRQTRASMMLPPLWLVPMRTRLGDYLAADGKKEEAIEAYRRSWEEWPAYRPTKERLDRLLGPGAAKGAGGAAEPARGGPGRADKGG